MNNLKENLKKITPNELYAIHLDDSLLDGKVYADLVGNSKHWKAPKKIFTKLGHAKLSLRHIPENIKKRCTIVRYIPG